MTDTPNHVRRVYADFIMQKSDADRFKMTFDMADTGRKMVESQFRQRYPEWSVGDIKAAVFERIYRDDFSPEEMKQIKQAMTNFHH